MGCSTTTAREIETVSVACPQCTSDDSQTVEIGDVMDGALLRTDYYCRTCNEPFAVWWD